MNPNPSHKAIFIKSLNRCIEKEGFIQAFYDKFLATSDEIRFMFRNTDFKEQCKRLEESLYLVAAATYGQQEGLQHLRERAITHSREHLNIKPELYELWRTAVLETVWEFDSEWNEEVEEAYDTILGFAIDFMTHRY